MFDEHGVVEVPEGAGSGVDDDVVDVARVFFEVGEHLLEDESFGDRLGASARFDELLHDVRAEFAGLAFDELALGGDRVAVLIDIA